MGLNGTGNREGRELSTWTLQSTGGKPLPGGWARAWATHEPPGGCGQGGGHSCPEMEWTERFVGCYSCVKLFSARRGTACGVLHYILGHGTGTRTALTEGTQRASGQMVKVRAELLGNANRSRLVTGLAAISRFLGSSRDCRFLGTMCFVQYTAELEALPC